MKNLMKNRSLAILTTVLSVVTCFTFLPQTQATPDALPPPPSDGCYPGFTTAEGCNALKLLTSGAGNTGLGWHSLSANTSGNFNTGVGAGTLILNNGDSNTATGAAALLLNTAGTQNTAVGTDAMVHNGTGSNNTALGALALFNNSTGDYITSLGANSGTDRSRYRPGYRAQQYLSRRSGFPGR